MISYIHLSSLIAASPLGAIWTIIGAILNSDGLQKLGYWKQIEAAFFLDVCSQKGLREVPPTLHLSRDGVVVLGVIPFLSTPQVRGDR